MLVQLVFALLVIWLLMLKWKRRHFDKLYEQIKTTRWSLPFIGHLYLFFCNDEEKMKVIKLLFREVMRVGGTAGIWLAQKLYIVIADPEVAEIVLKECLEKDDLYNCMHLGTGDGSIFASVKIWRPRRKYMAPTFNMKNLNRFAEMFSKQSCIMADKLKGAAGKGPVSMWKVYSLYSMDAICGSLGIETNAQENDAHPLLEMFEKFFNMITNRIFKPWLQSDFIYKLTPYYADFLNHKLGVYSYINQVIREKRNIYKNEQNSINKDPTKNCLKSFMDLIMESSANVSDVAICEETIVLMGAASDTSAVAIGYTTLMLARHPEVQEKVYNELKKVMSDLDKPISVEDLPHFTYLTAVIKETLRLYPPAPVIARKVEKTIKLPSGVTLLPGCGAIIAIMAINCNPKYWGEDADQFRPERFLDSEVKHSAAFMPFSYGPRNCIGYQYAMMSIKTVLATLLKQYRIVPASDELKHEPLRVKYDIMMRHVDNYCVKIESRT